MGRKVSANSFEKLELNSIKLLCLPLVHVGARLTENTGVVLNQIKEQSHTTL